MSSTNLHGSWRARALVLATTAAALLVTGCVPQPVTPIDTVTPPCSSVHPLPICEGDPWATELVEASYSQSQALPDFDDTTYAVTDAAALEELAGILAEHDAWEGGSVTGDCDGGRTSVLTWTTRADTTGTLTVDTCTDDPLAADVDDLVSAWHDGGVGEATP